MLSLPIIADAEKAAQRISKLAIESPLVPLFDKNANLQKVFLKLENMQKGGSFKIRAGANALLSLREGDLSKGIYTGSAGNFALGVAIAAKELKVKLKVFAPDTAAEKKVNLLQDMGVEVVLVPFAEWWSILENHGKSGEDGVFLHPVSNQSVLEGNATIGLEIMKSVPDVEAILVPFGGGGLISGIGAIAKSINPNVKIFGCESNMATPLLEAFKKGGPQEVKMSSSFINGIGSTSVLNEMWPLLKEVVDDVLVADIAEVKSSLRELVKKQCVITEGAGAVPVACLKSLGEKFTKVVCVVSGGNIDPKVLSEIIQE